MAGPLTALALPPQPFDYRGKVAWVTGASSGIGRAYAQALAARGAHVLLAARSGDALEALAQQLAAQHGVRAEAVAIDLAEPGAATRLHAQALALDMPPDVLINNAGFGSHGRFEALPAERLREEVQLNCLALMELAHAALPHMQAQRSGVVVNVASIAAFQGIPTMAVYAATKAFVLTLSEALHAENRALGVRVLALCPGPTETQFFSAMGSRAPTMGQPAMLPETVVRAALAAVDAGRSHTIPGASNRLAAWATRLGTRATATRVAGALMRRLARD